MFLEHIPSGSRRALKVSLVVGTLLSLINQSPALMQLSFPPETVARILMNYLVPFSVAIYSQHSLLREQTAQEATSTEGQN
ncbi:MAG: nitrate/nitrite transporter NrtS [Candidatus Marinimicrobia bacterium]|nr:nitrate/nitrite transporter NrtS [Candidatus Neomarinimicrobiota bacterium]